MTEKCAYLGEPVGRFHACDHPDPSDNHRPVCTPLPTVDDIQACSTCRDRKTDADPDSFLARYDRDNLWVPPQHHAPLRFNSSILPWEDGYLLAYRTRWTVSEIHLSKLDAHFVPIPCWHRKLDLEASGANYGCEDPRLFLHQGIPHVAYVGVVGEPGNIDHTNVMYARLDPDTLDVSGVFFPHYGGRQSWEKSWSFFESGEELYCVYQTTPRHQVLRIRGEEAKLAADLRNSIQWQGGIVRGGASPVRVGDEFWHFAHDRLEVGGLRVYRTLLFTFDTEPPFRPRRYVPHGILAANPYTMPVKQYCSCVYPGGAVRDGPRWIVSHGVHDMWTELHSWGHTDLENRLCEK